MPIGSGPSVFHLGRARSSLVLSSVFDVDYQESVAIFRMYAMVSVADLNSTRSERVSWTNGSTTL